MRPGAVVLAVLLVGCADRSVRSTAPAPPAPPDRGTYVDLKPGWRVRVVTPLLKSGGYRMAPAQTEESGSNLTIKAGDDFLGYETAHYRADEWGKGVRIAFSSSEVTREGKTEPGTRPQLQLFEFAQKMRHVRLIYLVRKSKADHNMAIVAARNPEALDMLTRFVQANPATGCGSMRDAICRWVPLGIAVRPEAP